MFPTLKKPATNIRFFANDGPERGSFSSAFLPAHSLRLCTRHTNGRILPHRPAKPSGKCPAPPDPATLRPHSSPAPLRAPTPSQASPTWHTHLNHPGPASGSRPLLPFLNRPRNASCNPHSLYCPRPHHHPYSGRAARFRNRYPFVPYLPFSLRSATLSFSASPLYHHYIFHSEAVRPHSIFDAAHFLRCTFSAPQPCP